MSVEIKYVVVRENKEVMTFTDKKEADAYDKMLDISEELMSYIEEKYPDLKEEQLEGLCVVLAKNKDDIGKLLKGTKVDKLNKKPTPKKNDTEKTMKADDKDQPETDAA